MKLHMDSYDSISFFNGLVFYAPVALLVRTQAGVSLTQFFILQALLSCTILIGEIPAGLLTDKIGYRRTLILSQLLLLLARILMLFAFLRGSFLLFATEAVAEGIAVCFSSGTGGAYIYSVYGEDAFLAKSTRAANWGTAGFLISTTLYVAIYSFFDIQGLLFATLFAGVLAILCVPHLKPEKRITETDGMAEREKHLLLQLMKEKYLWLLMLATSCLSMGFLLINFFYADKLQSCGMSLKLLTPIILVYSSVQMLAEKITGYINERNQEKFFKITMALAGFCLALFGVITQKASVLLLMLILPLLLDVPGFLLEKLENEFVDSCGAEKKRATVLSVINMGVNLLEMLILCASAVLAEAGIMVCFVILGVSTFAVGFVMTAGWIKRKQNIKTENRR